MSTLFHSLEEVRSHALACLTSEKFLAGRGLASQLPIFIAAHDPLENPESANLPHWLVQEALLAGVNVLHVDVFSELVFSLSDQGILDSVKTQEKEKVLSKKQIASAIHSAADLAIRIPARLQSLIEAGKNDALLLSGLGASYPHFRVTEIVGILEEMQLKVPAVILFPGSFDNTLKSPVLKLFGEIDEDHNYRALDLFNYEAQE